MANTQSNLPPLTQNDLREIGLFQLNSRLQFLAARINGLEGGLGPTKFLDQVVVPSAMAKDTSIPTDDHSLLTFGAAKQLFSPTAQRKAFITLDWFGTPVAPLPQPPSQAMFGSTVIEASDFCAGLGLSDSCINAAIAAAPADGASIHCRAGAWAINGAINMNRQNILLYGDGDATKFVVNAGNSFPNGVVIVTAGLTSIQNLLIDGSVTTSTQIDYDTLVNTYGGDPMNAALTTGSTVWLSNGASNVYLYYLTIQHSRGYAILLDARDHDITDVDIAQNLFQNNVATTYGDKAYANMGSWLGGVFMKGGGGGGHGDFRCLRVNVSDNSFRNVTGNCIWAHCYSTTNLHESFTHNNNDFTDIGRDPIEMGTTIGVTVTGNTMRRIGYVGGHPAYYPGQNAVAIDSSGYVQNGNVTGNSILNPNGEGMDLDGLCDATISGNSIMVSESTDTYYTEDEVASFGVPVKSGTVNTSGTTVAWVSGSKFSTAWPGLTIVINAVSYSVATVNPNGLSLTIGSSAGSQAGAAYSVTYASATNLTVGIQTNNTFDPRGAQKVTITGNTIKNMGRISISLFNAQQCFVTGNNISHPATAIDAPVVLGCSGSNSAFTSPPRHNMMNVVTKNIINYDVAGGQYCIYETDAYGDIDGPNYVFGNHVLGSNKGEFLPSASGLSGGSNSSREFFTNSGAIATPQADLEKTVMRREGLSTTGAFKIYRVNLATGVGHLVTQISDVGPIMNVSLDGGAHTGMIHTGNRVTAFGAVVDYVWSDKTIADGYTIYGRYNAATSFYDTEADTLDDSYGLLRYRRPGALGTGGLMEASVSTLAGVRVWTAIGGSGGGVTTVQGTGNQILVNGDAAAHTGAVILTLDVNVAIGAPGGGGTGTLTVYDPTTNAINSSKGGVTAQGLIALAAAGVYTGVFNSIQTAAGMLARSLTIASDTSAGYLNIQAGANPTPTAATNDSFTPNKSQVWMDNLNILRARINLGVMAIDGLAGDTAAGLKMGAFTGSGNRTVNIDFNTDTTYTDFGLRLIRGPSLYGGGNTGGNFTGALVNSGSGNLFIWSGAGTVVVAAGGSSSVPTQVAQFVNTGSATYVSSDGGYLSIGSAFNQFNAPNGGIHTNTATVENAAFYKQIAASGSLLTPSAGYGGIGHKSGSVYWYYNSNTTTWSQIDFAAIAGGVASLNALTGAVNIINGSGISVSTSTPSITIGNTGVLSLAGTANRVTVSPSVGNVTLSGPQDIHTGASPTFSSLSLTSAASNAANITGGVMCGQVGTSSGLAGSVTSNGGVQSATGFSILGGSFTGQVINAFGQFVGPGINVGSNGVACGGVNPDGGAKTGQTLNLQVTTPSGTATIHFWGGVVWQVT